MPPQVLPDPNHPETVLQQEANDARKAFGTWVRQQDTKFVEIRTNVQNCIDSQLLKKSESLLEMLGSKKPAGEKWLGS
jgi:hypothetical protein